MKTKQFITSILKEVDIEINGSRPWDIVVHDERFYDRVLSHGSLGIGESYMDGWWDCAQLDELIYRVMRNDLRSKVYGWRTILNIAPRLALSFFMDLGSKKRSHNIGKKHYDAGNDIYDAMLDKYRTYTCGYWRDAKNLDEAQEAKLDLVCRKLNLKHGMKVLDIGCGWGSFLKFAAEKYGIEGVGVTVSKNQKELGNKLCSGLPVEIKLMDYRGIEGEFDAIVSLGMFEHVGPKHYPTYMNKVKSLLKEDGLFLLHTIGGHRSRLTTDAWTNKYIFPGGVIPSLEQTSKAIQKSFIMEDWHNFGNDYYLTLKEWYKNFDKAWPELKKNGKYNERFYRMWKYYLLMSAGAFKARHLQLWQIVLSPRGIDGDNHHIRKH